MSVPPFGALRPGDKVGIFAPSGPVEPERYAAGLALLKARYRVVEAANVLAREGFFAGDDARRLAETQKLFDDPSVRALIAARGGYGAMRLLPALSLTRFQRDPIPIAGFSDITALHLAFRARALASIHGPVVTQLAGLPAADREAFFALMEGRESAVPGSSRSGNAIALEVLRAPRQSTLGPAPMIGGNLSLVSALVGTSYLSSPKGCVLFLEDVGEKPYRLDRMLVQIQLAGLLKGVLAIVFGDFTDCDPPRGEKAPTWRDVLAETCARVGIPAFLGFPAGHGERNLAFVHGAPVTITLQDRRHAYLHR
jgi:muramoyltetrapeptide carboxypeptidase